MIPDPTVNLFQIADVSRMYVVASCPEDQLPLLESLGQHQRPWTIETVGQKVATQLPGFIDQIGYVVDPNQHTLAVTGYVKNPGKLIRGGQYVTATVKIPPPRDVVEIPTDALVEDGLQSLVFVQVAPPALRFTMRRVDVTHRFEDMVFVRSTPIPKNEQRTDREADEGLLPKEPLTKGEHVLSAGAVELKAVVLDLESRHEKAPDVIKK
jgi:cobalt-zinc-cadmium efflux system membrane fusion protein